MILGGKLPMKLVTVPTRDNVKALGRCARELVRAGASVRVYDYSTSPAVINENKAALKELARTERVKIAYASNREVKSFVSRLDQLGVDPALVTPALEGPGGVRNQILLDTLGDKIVMVDDSVIPDFRVLGSYDSAQFKSFPKGLSANPSVFKTGDSPDAAVSEALTQRKKGGGIDTMLGLLGRSVAELRAEHLSSGDIVTGYRTSGKVMAAQVGYVGLSPGTDWQGHSEIQGCIRGYTSSPRQHTYQHASHLKTFVLALDNSGARLPPFLPSESYQGDANAGSLYGPLLSKALSNAYAAFVPEVVMYRPANTRPLSAILELPAHTFLLPILKTTKSIDSFAQILIDAESNDSAARWVDTLVQEYAKQAADLLNDRVRALANDPLKTNNNLENLRIVVKTPTHEELASILSFGRLIEAWPNIVEASKLVLNNRSNGLTVTL